MELLVKARKYRRFAVAGAVAMLAAVAVVSVVYLDSPFTPSPGNNIDFAQLDRETAAAAAIETVSIDPQYLAGRFIIPAVLCIGLTIELLWFVGAFRRESGDDAFHYQARHDERLP